MGLTAIAFYLLAAVTLAAGFAVVMARNPVHSVLFLFVVMMLDVDFVKLREGYARYLPLGGIVAAILLAEMIMISLVVVQGGAAADAAGPTVATADMTNVEAIGRVLYTDYVYIFQAAGIVLLIAMIGAIVLTLRHKPGVRRQNIGRQVARTARSGMRVVDIKPGEGIDA